MTEKQTKKSLAEIIGQVDRDELRRLTFPIIGLEGRTYYGRPPPAPRSGPFGSRFSIYAHFLDLKDSIVRSADNGKTGVLTEEELEAWRDDFSYYAETLDANQYRSEPLFPAAVAAVEAAFVLGIASGNSEFTQAIVDRLQKGRTEDATKARRADTVQAIIRDEAQAHWNSHPDEKPRAIAVAIWRRVQARLNQSDSVPGAWRSGDRDKWIERIRKRLSRMI
jgi:hypothetical protein